MTWQAALRARLLGQTAAGSKVYWLNRPQGTDLPAVTLQTISSERPQTHGGMLSYRESRVQFDAWASSPAAAQAMVDAAVAALAPRHTGNGVRFDRTFFENERDTLERLETQTIYRAGIDLIVRHSPA